MLHAPLARASFLSLSLALAGLSLACGKTQAAQKATSVPAPATPHWGYEGEHGPAAWGTLCPEFSMCGTGKSQSPIDISGAKAVLLPEMKTSYAPAQLRVVHHEHVADLINNGHTVQVNYPAGSTLVLGEQSFDLAQYHFHAPSEHTLEGQHFPMEMHLVHKSAQGNLAVLGVFISEGAANAAFEPVWANLPKEKGVEVHLEHVTVDVDALLPKGRAVYRYEGSLTTPPCSEGVQWLVFAEPITLSAEQIAAFRALVHDNNRPVQPLNGRKIGG